MRKKVLRALSLLLTVTVIGTSVPSVVLAEDFSQQPEIQWDSEEFETTVGSEEQEQTETEEESGELEAADDFTSDVIEESASDQNQDSEQIPEQDIQEEENSGDISMDSEELALPEEEEEILETEEVPEGQIGKSEELVSAGESSAAKIVASGKCGALKRPEEGVWGRFIPINEDGSNIQDNAKWTLDSTGTLTISGSGEITSCLGNYDGSYSELDLKAAQPWFSYDDQIKKVIVEEGITSVGKYNFMRCKNLKNVQLPKSLEVIYERAFRECGSLTEIKGLDQVEFLDNGAFEKCTSLEKVKLSDDMQCIYSSVFYRSGLKEIVIPQNVITIYPYAFSRWLR